MPNMPKMIFITGGSASGKTTLANQMKAKFGKDAILISQDSFYKSTGNPNANYDVPKAFDFKLQKEVFAALARGEEVEIPIYDFSTHSRNGTRIVTPAPIIIFEGLFTFYDSALLKNADLKVFVDTPADTRLGRRIIRDVKERGRDVAEVIARWNKDVQPSYKQFISNTKNRADMIIPWVIVNHRATEFLVATIANIRVKNDK